MTSPFLTGARLSSRTETDGTFHDDPEECEARFAEGMDRTVRDLGPREWRVAHAHVTSIYLNESEHLLRNWRADVEAQGCELINTGISSLRFDAETDCTCC